MCEFEVKKGTLKKYTGNGGHVVIPDGVKTIAKSVFKGRKDLQSIVIPEGVTALPTEAFAGCTSLTSVELPRSIESIGYRAFYKTPWLESQGEFAMVHDILLAYQGRNKKVVIPAEVTKINSYAFEKNKTVQEIVIPENVKTIGDFVFRGCSKLKKIVLPEGITSISGSMFENCTALESITIPKNVTVIGGSAFERCTSLKEIVIPEGVSRVAGFQFCSGLKKVSLPNSITEIGGGAFECCSSLQSISLPDSITEIGWCAFDGCSSLQSISLPDSITKLGAWAFSSCRNLQSISLPSSITKMEESNFSCCFNLQSVSLPKHMKIIPERTFFRCERLTNVMIPDGVTTIEAYAFAKCPELQSIVIPQSVKEIKGSAFSESGLQYIEIPESVVSLGEKAFAGTNMQYVVLPDAITDWASLGIPEGTIVKHTSDGYDHLSAAQHVIEQLPEWPCYPVEIEKWLKAKKKEQGVKLYSTWKKMSGERVKQYNVEGWWAFRGPTFIIDQLLNDLQTKNTRNREDYPNGISQVEISPACVIEHEDGYNVIGNSIISEDVLKKYAVLQFACFISYIGQSVVYSVSGDGKLTKKEYIDGAKNEGDHWVIQHSPLENVKEETFDTRTGESWMSNYTFPFAHEWYRDVYIFEKDGCYYRCSPPAKAD